MILDYTITRLHIVDVASINHCVLQWDQQAASIRSMTHWRCLRRGQGGNFLPNFLADQLTLFQPGPGADYAHHITTSPPDFWTVRRLCDNIINLLVVIRIRTDGRSKNLVEGAMSCLFYFCPVRRKLGRLLLPTPASIGSGN